MAEQRNHDEQKRPVTQQRVESNGTVQVDEWRRWVREELSREPLIRERLREANAYFEKRGVDA